MDPELQKSLADLLAYVKQGADFAVAQAPAVAQEIVNWQIALSIVEAAAFVFLAWVALRCVRWAKAEAAKGDESHWSDESHLTALIVGRIGVVVSALLLFSRVGVIAQAIVAPRLAIIEYLTAHMK